MDRAINFSAPTEGWPSLINAQIVEVKSPEIHFSARLTWTLAFAGQKSA